MFDEPEGKKYEPYQPPPSRFQRRLTYLRKDPQVAIIAVVALLVLFGFAIQAMETMTFAAWGTFVAFGIIVGAAVWTLVR